MITEKIQQNFDNIITTLSHYNLSINLHSYFDFLGDFIKTHYQNFTLDNLNVFINSLAQRIEKEINHNKQKGKTLNIKNKKPVRISSKANIRINKCWNTIRFVAEHDYFVSNYLNAIEESLRPLFEYLAKPQTIDFDDDILFCICSIMKKSKCVSDSIKHVFRYLPQFHLKYKGIFGHLFQALNYYVVYGKDFFETSKENLSVLFEMANLAMFNKNEPIMLSNNAEGSLLYHVILQNSDGPLIVSALPDILSSVYSRL